MPFEMIQKNLNIDRQNLIMRCPHESTTLKTPKKMKPVH